MQREHSLVESVARGAVAGATASLVVIPLASRLLRRLGRRRVIPAMQLESTLSRSLGMKRRAALLGEEPGVFARQLLVGLLWGAAYGAARSSGRVPATTSGPLFGFALGALDTWLAPRIPRIFPTSDGNQTMPELVQVGLHVLFGTLVGQVFEADGKLMPRTMAPPLGLSSEAITSGVTRRSEAENVSARIGDSAARSTSVATQPPRTFLGRSDLAGRLVFSRDDHALGKVKGFTQGHVEVEAPTLDIGPTLYVPYDALGYCTPAGCYLRYTLEQMAASGWNQVPTAVYAGEQASSTSGPATAGDSGLAAGGSESELDLQIPYFVTEEEARRDLDRRRSF